MMYFIQRYIASSVRVTACRRLLCDLESQTYDASKLTRKLFVVVTVRETCEASRGRWMGEQWFGKNGDAAVPLYTPASLQCPWPPLSANRLNVTTSGPFHFLKRSVNSTEIGDEILANIWL